MLHVEEICNQRGTGWRSDVFVNETYVLVTHLKQRRKRGNVTKYAFPEASRVQAHHSLQNAHAWSGPESTRRCLLKIGISSTQLPVIFL